MTTWTAGEIGLNGALARLYTVSRAGTLSGGRGPAEQLTAAAATAQDGGAVSASVVSSMAGSYAAYAAAAVDLDPAGRVQAWEGLHMAAHPGLLAFVGQVNDDAGERGSVGGADLTARAAMVRDAEPRAGALVTRLAGELAELLGADPVPVVLLAGTTAANGWVDVHDDQPTLFLELSQLPPAPYDTVLVAHELTHVAHQRRRTGAWPDTVAACTFAEGLATAVSRDLAPGLGDAAYLWFADGHQPWLDACAADDLRADSAYYAHDVMAAARRGGARFSVTARMNPTVIRAIAGIEPGAWVPIRYPNAVWDDDEQRLVSDAEVADVPFTAFTSRPRRDHLTARLIVRRVRRLNPAAVHTGQGELFPAYRHHPVFTDSPLPMLDAEICHRGHAVIEQVIADLKPAP